MKGEAVHELTSPGKSSHIESPLAMKFFPHSLPHLAEGCQFETDFEAVLEQTCQKYAQNSKTKLLQKTVLKTKLITQTAHKYLHSGL